MLPARLMLSVHSHLARLWQARLSLLLLVTLAISLFPQPAQAVDQAYWRQYNASAATDIDHHLWQQFLDRYVVVAKTSTDINRVDYSHVSPADRAILEQYLAQMQALNPLDYNRDQQQAYWINLYNALTVELILANYPVKSITKLGNKFFSFGPWDDNAATVNGIALSLNDIEHEILRPIWRDPRIHYAVNCASIGCPNLAANAYTEADLEQQLETGAYAYINHPRGVSIQGDELFLSSIYKWYAEDFGGNKQAMIKHVQHYANQNLRQALEWFAQGNGDINYDYDWRLNQTI